MNFFGWLVGLLEFGEILERDGGEPMFGLIDTPSWDWELTCVFKDKKLGSEKEVGRPGVASICVFFKMGFGENSVVIR